MFIYFFLGVIVGLLVSVLVVVVSQAKQHVIRRVINQLESHVKLKGAILEPESEDLQEWVNGLKKE